MKLWFGEHRDKELEDVPTPYLNWLLNDTEPDIGKHDTADVIKRKRERWQELMSEVEDELERRRDEKPAARRDYDDDDAEDDDSDFGALRF